MSGRTVTAGFDRIHTRKITVSPESITSPDQEPRPTEALVTEAVLKCLREIQLEARMRIRDVKLTPAYAITDDLNMLSADVTVKLSLIFHRPTEAS